MTAFFIALWGGVACALTPTPPPLKTAARDANSGAPTVRKAGAAAAEAAARQAALAGLSAKLNKFRSKEEASATAAEVFPAAKEKTKAPTAETMARKASQEKRAADRRQSIFQCQDQGHLRATCAA